MKMTQYNATKSKWWDLIAEMAGEVIAEKSRVTTEGG